MRRSCLDRKPIGKITVDKRYQTRCRNKERKRFEDVGCLKPTIGCILHLVEYPRFKRLGASLRQIVPSALSSGDGHSQPAKVFSMPTESGTFGTGPAKDCSDGLDNFEDDVRPEKIDRLRKILGEKTYHVSAADLARKIIDHMLSICDKARAER
jgi:Anti-sigma-28 factor, FlgM